MRLLVAEEPGFRRGIDGLAQVCREILHARTVFGTVFVFRTVVRRRSRFWRTSDSATAVIDDGVNQAICCAGAFEAA